MFETLTLGQKKLIFKNVNPAGIVTIIDFKHGDKIIHNMKELDAARNLLEKGMYASIQDPKLFDLTFGVALDNHAASSDNNIFNWIDAWSVRRVPQVDAIKHFIKEYFGSFKTIGASTADWSKLQPIADQISQGQFGWLEIFMKQTNVLYQRGDRVLNLLLPIALTIAGMWYVSRNFKWSAR